MLSRLRIATLLGATLTVALVATACRESSTEATDSVRCEHAGEFAVFGCARIVAAVTAPSGAPISRPWMVVFVRPVKPNVDWDGAVGTDSSLGPVAVLARLLVRPLAGRVDTATVWIGVRVRYETRRPGAVEVSDSTMRLLRFTPVGTRIAPDTVTFALPMQ